MLLRIFGYLILVASIFGVSAGEEDIGVALTFWFGAATVAALIVAITLAYLLSARRKLQREI